MITNSSNFNSKSICVTCLSQDRKLYAVSNTRSWENFYIELSLKCQDKICWECYYTLRKMIAFKSKAHKAQAWLRSTAKQQHGILSLSSLTTSTGVSINITEPGPAHPHTDPKSPVLVTVKQETMEDCADDESGASANKNAFTSKVNVKKEYIEVEVPILSHTADRKRNPMPTPSKPLDNSNTEVLETEKERTEKKKKKPEAKRKIEPPPSTLLTYADDAYTSETMTEEQMLEWKERKKTSKFFTQSIPTERCDICVQTFTTGVKAKAHALKHTDVYGSLECDICQRRSVNEGMLDFHRRHHYNLFKCRYCDFEWDEVNTMRQHCADLHDVRQTTWDCEECDRQFPELKHLKKHDQTHRLVKCPECSKHILKPFMKTHVLLHADKSLRQCNVCGKGCRNEQSLTAHMYWHKYKQQKGQKSIEDMNSELFCKECLLQCDNIHQYMQHLKTRKHNPNEQYQFECETCKKKYPTEKRRQDHIDAVHLNKKPHKCPQCGKCYFKRSRLRVHIASAHERQDTRMHICDLCGKTFKVAKSLREHLLSHQGLRPYQCKLCPSTFTYSAALYTHNRLKHLKIKGKKPKETQTNVDDQSHQ